jgi:hypothetical protein
VLNPTGSFCRDPLRTYHGAHVYFSAWAELFILPGEQDYFNPTFYARNNKLHLEARYNYEDYSTASLWAGRRFLFGKEVKFVIVPMVAVVFGNTNGAAPGLELEIMYKEVLIFIQKANTFSMSTRPTAISITSTVRWPIDPYKPIRFGMVVQRTRLFESELELQRGFFADTT